MFEKFVTPNELIPSDPRFACGPSLVPVEFLEDLYKTRMELLGTSHRKPAVKNLVKEIQEGLRTYFKVPNDYQIVLGNGGATLLFDMISLGMVDKKSAHFTCGEFSNKWYKSAKLVPWIEAEEFAVDYGKGINAENKDGFDLIATTLNETSTGVQISCLPEVDDKTILAIDATSGAGQIPCDISKTDIFFFSPQKVFASEGGLFVAILSPKALERAAKIGEDKSRYVPGIMNWKVAIDNSLKNQTYNTPAISTLFFLNEQIKRMNKIGYKKVCGLAEEKAQLLYNWAKDRPYLSAYIEDDQFRSRAVATIDVDEKFNTNELISILEKEKTVNGIDAYRKLGRNQFRISLFHNISLADLTKLTKIISLAIENEI